MTKWKYRGGSEGDEFVRVDKIRKRKSHHKRSLNARDPFESSELHWPKTHDSKPCFSARVVEVHKRYAFVSPEVEIGDVDTKDVWLATIARRYLTARKNERHLIAVGDRVCCSPTQNEQTGIDSDLPTATVLHRSPRKGKLARRDPMNGKVEHVLASNVDQVVIVASLLQPKIKWGLIDRYLVLAEEQGLGAQIVLNKVDLLKEGPADFKTEVEEMLQLYQRLGFPTHLISCLDGAALCSAVKTLGQALADKVSLFSGHSGVGKSSLVNLFDPEIIQDVEENPNIFYKGRHTTTYASFIKLKKIKGYVIDTPGVRSLLVGQRSSIELSFAYPEMRKYMNACKYRECRHLDEPECAVIAALDKGEIHRSRYRSYKTLLLGGFGRQGRSGLLNAEEDVMKEGQGDEYDF